MSYFCFIDFKGVPHMETLRANALDEAPRLLRQHPSGIVARLFHGDDYAATVRRDGDSNVQDFALSASG